MDFAKHRESELQKCNGRLARKDATDRQNIDEAIAKRVAQLIPDQASDELRTTLSAPLKKERKLIELPPLKGPASSAD